MIQQDSGARITDIVVVGSGVGGVSCAALLARYGFDVILCESYPRPGGAAHAFERGGYHGIGLPAVAASGMIAANTLAPVQKQLEMLRDIVY